MDFVIEIMNDSLFYGDASVHADNISNTREIKSRGVKIIRTSNKNNPIYDFWISLPDVPKMFYSLVQTIPFQLMAYYLAIERGNDLEYPRNLTKGITLK